MLRRRLLVSLGLPAVSAVAQAVTPYPLPDARTTVVVLTVGRGLDDEAPARSGSLLAALSCRLEAARRAAPEAMASGLRSGAHESLAFVEVPAGREPGALAFVAAFLGPIDLPRDEVSVQLARAALRADDSDWLFPGSSLRGRARRALALGGAARGENGSVRCLRALGVAGLRRAIREPIVAEAAVFGEVDDEFLAALGRFAAIRPVPTARPSAVRAPIRDRTSPGGRWVPERHPRVDGPYVAVAHAVPPSGRTAALAVAVEVARGEALRRFGARRGLSSALAAARADFVRWSWLDDDPVLVFCLRGADGEDPVDVRRELEAFVAEAVVLRPTARALARARSAVLGEIEPWPWPPEIVSAVVASPGALPGRAVTAVLAARRGIGRADVSDVTGDSARAALSEVLGAGGSWVGALVPEFADRPHR